MGWEYVAARPAIGSLPVRVALVPGERSPRCCSTRLLGGPSPAVNSEPPATRLNPLYLRSSVPSEALPPVGWCVRVKLQPRLVSKRARLCVFFVGMCVLGTPLGVQDPCMGEKDPSAGSG